MLIRLLPLLAGIAPVIAATVAHRLAIDAGILADCIPYFEGCTSISATGRGMPHALVFKPVHYLFAVALLFVWHFTSLWLNSLRDSPVVRPHRALLSFGYAGALALVIYLTFLGTTEAFYEFMRRFGIYFYFLGTVVAQVLTALSVRSIAASGSRLRRQATALLALSLLPIVLGLANFAQKAVIENHDPIENSIEWIAALSMQSFFVVLYFAWRGTGFSLQVRVRKDSTSAR